MITFDCEKCGQKYNLVDTDAGKEIICKSCQVMITVPVVQQRNTISFDTSYDAGTMFMKKNYELFEALLKHEREAPALEMAS